MNLRRNQALRRSGNRWGSQSVASTLPENLCRLTDALQSVRCSRARRFVNHFPSRKSSTDQGSDASSYASEERSEQESSQWPQIAILSTTQSDKRGRSDTESQQSTYPGMAASNQKHAQNLRSRNAAFGSRSTCHASHDHVRWSKAKEGPIAQRLEHRTHNPLVPGSNPGGPTRRPCLSRRPATTRTARQAFPCGPTPKNQTMPSGGGATCAERAPIPTSG